MKDFVTNSNPTKQTLIGRSLLIAGGLTLGKLAVFFVTNSVAILASSVDSAMDFVVSFANFVLLHSASKPPDEGHPYGHGKIESVAGFLQSLLIGAATIGVSVGALRRLYHPQPLAQPMAGLIVMAVALVFNLWHVRNLKKNMVRTESQLIATEYLHYVSDSYVYAGVFVSFLLVRFTGFMFWDPLVSLLIVVYLAKSVMGVFGDSLSELLDQQLPDEILKEIDHTIRTFHPQVVDYHDLRTRKVGLTKFIEFHVVLRGVDKFDDAHELTERLVQKLRTIYPGAIVTVHSDPEGVVEKEV